MPARTPRRRRTAAHIATSAAALALTGGAFALPALADPPQGDPVPNTVPATATVVRLLSSVKESPSASRLIVVSGLKVGDKTVVAHCWCEAAKRDTFETKFVQIASSLR